MGILDPERPLRHSFDQVVELTSTQSSERSTAFCPLRVVSKDSPDGFCLSPRHEYNSLCTTHIDIIHGYHVYSNIGDDADSGRS